MVRGPEDAEAVTGKSWYGGRAHGYRLLDVLGQVSRLTGSWNLAQCSHVRPGLCPHDHGSDYT